METRRAASASPYEAEFSFCRALRVGDRALVAGTAPIGPDGTTEPGDARAQAERCFDIIATALEELGASMTDVVRTRMFLVDVADWPAVAAAHGDRFRAAPPVATCVVVKALLDEAWRVEIEAEAHIARPPP